MRNFIYLAILFSTLTVFTVPTPAQAGFVTGLAACGTACAAITRNSDGTTNTAAFDACAALCRAMKACNTFTYEKCAALCAAPAEGSGYIGYYGTTVPCVAACNLIFAY